MESVERKELLDIVDTKLKNDANEAPVDEAVSGGQDADEGLTCLRSHLGASQEPPRAPARFPRLCWGSLFRLL